MALTQISTAGVKDDAVTSGKIPANAVGSSEIAADAVTTAKIAAGNVTETELASNAVTGAKIATGAINNANKIQDSIITGAKIGSGTVAAGNLASNSVTTAKIAAEAVTLDKLAHGTSSNDGKFLRANNGADPTFESIPAGITINNQADNRIVTATGTTDTLNGEANATFTGTKFNLGPYDGGTDVNLNILNNNSGGYGAYIAGGSGTNYVLRLDDYQQNAKFRFNANGKLGIGTGSPIGQVHLYQASNDPYMYIQRGSGDTSATIGGIFWRNSTNNLGLIDVQSGDIDAGRMRFYVNKNGTLTESLKIDEYGNLEVLDASEARLQVKTPSNGIIALRADGTNTQLGTWSDHDLKIVRNSTIKASITSNGLCFNSDTAAANALDDYEEGTWTPAVTASQGSSASTNVYHASYTKVGNQVFITCYVGAGANSNTSGLWMISGLPFTSKSNNHYFSISVGYWNSLQGNINHLTGTVQPNDTNILMRGTSGATSATSNLAYATYVGNGTEFLLSATYLVP
tara:strand:- start:362 stop:1912 length:1551 start_codon:yes stop_codon:yes gene_type:complete